ncbi:rCG57998 [Rattus norvegicus]|uniref:RCG57998 n=1 Tax=Rattus norvegicus TaxID=10116 RepID=A6J4U3_RAT|nr:rCG57998 [Rattus norvegicus]
MALDLGLPLHQSLGEQD